MPSYTFDTGKGLSEPCPPYRQAAVFGAPLGSVSASYWNCIATMVGSTTSFDLSTIRKNSEVIAAQVAIRYTNQGAHTFRWRAYRDRDNKQLFDESWSLVAVQGGWAFSFCFFGWCDQELNENGSYRLEVEVSGAGSYQGVKFLTISGIPLAAPEPPPTPVPAAGIVEAFNSVSAFFHSLYLTTYSWVWPFWYVADLFFGLSVMFSTLAQAFSDFITLVNNLISQVANVLSWDAIWSYILSVVPNLTQIRDWFYSWATSVLKVVTDWWSSTQTTVQGWLAYATQGLADLRASWDNFSTSVLPNLVSLTWLTAWWNARLLDIQSLINTAFTTRDSWWAGWSTWRDSVAEFFANPIQYVWERFMDWFLGPEGR